MKIEPEISGVHLVVAGDFSPTMFTPAWFELHNLLPKGTADRAELQMAAPDFLIFSLDWLEFRAMQDRLMFHTTHEPYIRICDLVIKLFEEPLSHLPITAIGINRDVHFCVGSPAERFRIGRELAPLKPWGHVGEKLHLGCKNDNMPSLSIVGGCDDERPSEDKRVITVQSSARTANKKTGIYVGINDHFTITKDVPDAQRQFLTSFGERFGSSIENSDDIVNQVMSLADDRRVG